ncbi:CapA family protein [Calidifontibacter terrae]
MTGLRGIRAVAAVGCVATLALAGCAGSDSKGSQSGTTTGSKSVASGSSTGGAVASTASGASNLTIEFSGDDIPQEEIIASAKKIAGGNGYNFDPLFADIKPFTSSADLSICQMEGALSPDDTNLTSGLRHHGPKEFAAAVKKVGYDGCSTANNHSFDAGVAGLKQTREVMAAAGLKAAGPGPDASTPGNPAMYDVKGVKIAHLSYSYTLDNFAAGNDVSVPSSAPWLKAAMWKDKGADGIIADAKAARANGAQIVLVSIHWGQANNHTPTAAMTQTAQAVLQSGAVDTIIGNHAHVVQPCQLINGRMAFFGLGNQISNQDTAHWGFPDATQDGVMVKVSFQREPSGAWKQTGVFQPTRVDVGGGYPIRIMTAAKNKKSYDRTSGVIKGDGSCGLTAAS